MNLIERLIEGYEKAKKPIAYAVMILAVLLGSLPAELIPEKLKGVTYATILMILALILMEILFELYEKVVKENKKLNQINSNELYAEISGIVGNEKKVSIKFIGVAGRFGWQNVIEKLLNENAPNSSLNVYLYDHMPNMLGFLINENYLFLTHTYWEYLRNELVLRAGGADYFIYDKNDDFGGQELIKRFNGWFEFIEQEAKKRS